METTIKTTSKGTLIVSNSTLLLDGVVVANVHIQSAIKLPKPTNGFTHLVNTSAGKFGLTQNEANLFETAIKTYWQSPEGKAILVAARKEAMEEDARVYAVRDECDANARKVYGAMTLNRKTF